MAWFNTIEEFVQKHGGKQPLRISNNVLAFPDGATLEQGMGGEQGWEPPADPGKRLGIQRAYYRALLTKNEKDFQLHKRHLLDGTPCSWDHKTYGPAPQDGVELLRVLQSHVLLARESLAAIEAQINALPEVQEQKRLNASVQESLREQAEQRRQYQEAIDSVRI